MTPPTTRPVEHSDQQLPQSRLGWWPGLHEVIFGIGSRLLRVALTIAGTVLGTATLVGVLGLTTSAQGQVSDRFSFLRATSVDVAATDATYGIGGFGEDAERRVAALNGVNAAGTATEVYLRGDRGGVTATAVRGMTRDLGPIKLYGASVGFFEASLAKVSVGRTFDRFCVEQRCRVAVVGTVAAKQLGINHFRPGVTIFIDGAPFQVIGIIDDMQRNTGLLGGIIIPNTTAYDVWGPPTEPVWMTIDTRIGAAHVVGAQIGYALRPETPESYQINLPPDPRMLQGNVGGDLSALFLGLAGITLIVGAFGIANLTTVSVMERIPEIGLRRALGARPIHIGTQFVGESGVLGLLGGLIGTPIGITVVLAVCLTRQWTALLPAWLILTPLLGLAVGLLAGIYPARRAAQVEPVAALQR